MTTPELPDIGTVTTPRRLPRAFSNVQPFTYEDGLTHYQILEKLRAFVQYNLIPELNKVLQEFGDEIEELVEGTLNDILAELAETIANIDAQLTAQTEYVDGEIADMITYVNNAVQSIINNAIEVSDPVVAGVLEDNQSLSAQRVYELSGEPTLRPNLLYPSVSTMIRPDRSLEDYYRARVDLVASHGGGFTLCPYETISDPSSAVFTRVPESLSNGLIDMCEDSNVPIYMIKPHIVTVAGGDGFYRMNYNPTDKAAFWANWRTELMYWASVCEARNIPYLCMTVEMGILTKATYADNWRSIIEQIRATYPNVKLTASYTTAELWNQWESPGWIKNGVTHMAQYLDAYGINSWVTLTDKVYDPANPDAITNDEMVKAYWLTAQGDEHQQRLIDVCSRLNIPYWLTEIGCRPYYNGLANQSGGGTFDPEDYGHEVQAILYKSIFDGIANSDYCIGLSIWHIDGPFNYADLGENYDVETDAVKVLELYMKQKGAITA